MKKADVSQFSVLVDLVKGNNIAVEGPPGTGNQTRSLTRSRAALAKGKKVLFVAEKSAALKVVHSRLEEVGAGRIRSSRRFSRARGVARSSWTRSRSRLDVVEPSPRYLQQERERRTRRRGTVSHRYVSMLSEEWNGSADRSTPFWARR